LGIVKITVINMPNHSIPEEKKEKIVILSERYNKGYVAKQLDISVDTVNKYLDKEKDKRISF